MKKICLTFAAVVFTVLAMQAADAPTVKPAAEAAPEEAEALIDYDFTGEFPQYKGDYERPKFNRPTPRLAAGDRGMIFPGNLELTIPESTDISLRRGLTLFAVVKMDDTGTKPGADDAHDMIFFKHNEFLLGRSTDKLYFNANFGKGWVMSTMSEYPCPVNKKIAVAVTVTPEAKAYNVVMYINGNVVAQARYAIPANFEASDKEVTVGKGWGGPWFFKGTIYKLAIFEEALPEAKIVRLSKF